MEIEDMAILNPLAETVGSCAKSLRLKVAATLKLPVRPVTVAETGPAPIVAESAEMVTVAESAPLSAKEKLLKLTDGLVRERGPSVVVGSRNLKPVKAGDAGSRWNPLWAPLVT